MDQVKTGELIRHMRVQLGLTQKQLAERINVSDKAVSKWECGNGCPIFHCSGSLPVFSALKSGCCSRVR